MEEIKKNWVDKGRDGLFDDERGKQGSQKRKQPGRFGSPALLGHVNDEKGCALRRKRCGRLSGTEFQGKEPDA